MADRTATDTIKGYFYQFDYSILQLLETPKATDMVTIEGVEDIDLSTATETTAIQCKYYSKSEYNHSVIAGSIRLMLSDFKERKDRNQPSIQYKLYGFYKTGQHKLSLPIDVEFLKKHFLTYTEKKNTHYHHTELGLTDNDLNEFLSKLTIVINGLEYQNQFTKVLDLFKKQFHCSDFEAENFYYNNALKVIKDLAVEGDINKRKISNAEFLRRINIKTILFNEWFVQLKGKEKHFKDLRKQYFTGLNTSPFERFFLIDIQASNYKRSEVKDLLFTISKKWSKLSSRESKPFCPYVYLHNIPPQELIEIKKELQTEEFIAVDGFDFQGAEFSPVSLSKAASSKNQIKLKIVNELRYLKPTIQTISKTKEIYQFYKTNILFWDVPENINNINIQIEEIKDIKEII
jgi:hypothetical protein